MDKRTKKLYKEFVSHIVDHTTRDLRDLNTFKTHKFGMYRHIVQDMLAEYLPIEEFDTVVIVGDGEISAMAKVMELVYPKISYISVDPNLVNKTTKTLKRGKFFRKKFEELTTADFTNFKGKVLVLNIDSHCDPRAIYHAKARRGIDSVTIVHKDCCQMGRKYPKQLDIITKWVNPNVCNHSEHLQVSFMGGTIENKLINT